MECEYNQIYDVHNMGRFSRQHRRRSTNLEKVGRRKRERDKEQESKKERERENGQNPNHEKANGSLARMDVAKGVNKKERMTNDNKMTRTYFDKSQKVLLDAACGETCVAAKGIIQFSSKAFSSPIVKHTTATHCIPN